MSKYRSLNLFDLAHNTWFVYGYDLQTVYELTGFSCNGDKALVRRKLFLMNGIWHVASQAQLEQSNDCDVYPVNITIKVEGLNE